MIEVKNFPNKGRGIVATKLLSAGTLIESAPASSFAAEQWKAIKTTEVFKYCFVILSEYSGKRNVDGYIVFGLSSLCNHSETPNAYIQWIEDEIGLWAYLKALSDIQPGEEVLVYYTNIDEYFLSGEFV